MSDQLAAAPASLTLNGGGKVVGWRETSQTSATGTIQQGIAVVVQLPSGNTTTVFIPYVLAGSTEAIAAALNERIAQIQAIEGL